MLSTAQAKQFYELGFLILPNVVSANLIERLKQALEKTQEKVNQAPTKYNARLITKKGEVSDTWGVNNILSPQLYDKCFDDIMSEEKILRPIQGLIGEELRFWGAHALWSPQQNDYELYWHRDMIEPEIYEPTGKPNHVQCNIPTFIDSCFHVIPGSHRRPPTELELIQMKKSEYHKLPNEVVVTCLPGDVLLMNAWTIHRGSCSFNQIRRTMHFCLQPKNELYGGNASPRWMRDDTYLNSLNDSTKKLMRNLIDWDDEHPLSHDELVALRRKSKNNREYLTKKSNK